MRIIVMAAMIFALTGCAHVLLRRPHPRLIKNPKTVAVLSGKKPKGLVVLVRRDQPFDAVVHVDGSDHQVSGTLLGCRGDKGVLVVDRHEEQVLRTFLIVLLSLSLSNGFDGF